MFNKLTNQNSFKKPKKDKILKDIISENDCYGLGRVETYDLLSESSMQSGNKSFGKSHGFSPQYVKNIELKFA